MDLNNMIEHNGKELDFLTLEVLSHPMPHRLVSMMRLWSPVFHKYFWAGYEESHIPLEPEKIEWKTSWT